MGVARSILSPRASSGTNEHHILRLGDNVLNNRPVSGIIEDTVVDVTGLSQEANQDDNN